SQPQAAIYTYNGDALRMTAQSWSASTSSVQTTDFTWNTVPSALIVSGSFDYLYGLNAHVPIAQIDTSNSVTGALLTDPSTNVRGIVEVSSSAANPFALDNYTDYDAYGNPITGSGGTAIVGGLRNRSGSDGDSATAFGFGGGFLDPTQLSYLVNRYYDAQLGSFISSDP